ncbi:MAG: P-loop NTPase [Myxococcaceae bacterium]
MSQSEAEIIELPVSQAGSPRTPQPKKVRARRVVAIGGGKGGIGKSLLSANLGIALAKRGARVVLVDLDLGGANLHTCLGVGQPQVSLSDFVERRVTRLEQVLCPTPHERLMLVSGAMDGLDAANPRHGQKTKLIRNLRLLDVDYVLLDLGAGTAFNVLDFFLVADTGLVVMLPEPTSIENAYRFIKAAFFRRLQTLAPEDDFAQLVGNALAPRDGSPTRTPWDVVAELRQVDLEKAGRLEQALAGFRPWVVVNQARTRADFDVGQTVSAAWKKFFGLELGFLGTVSHDDSVWQAVRARKSLLDAFPESAAAAGVLRVAENLIALERA